MDCLQYFVPKVKIRYNFSLFFHYRRDMGTRQARPFLNSCPPLCKSTCWAQKPWGLRVSPPQYCTSCPPPHCETACLLSSGSLWSDTSRGRKLGGRFLKSGREQIRKNLIRWFDCIDHLSTSLTCSNHSTTRFVLLCPAFWAPSQLRREARVPHFSNLLCIISCILLI